MSTKPILAYDCATIGASVALMHEERAHTRAIANTQQAAELIPTIDALLREHQVHYADLGAMITTIGPGSFTGVRIGLAALHGLVAVYATPIKLLTTLEAIAWQVSSMSEAPPAFVVTLRAGKGEVYTQLFALTDGKPKPTSEISLTPETKTDWPYPCYGSATNASRHVIETPDASLLCSIASLLPSQPLSEALPVYVRPPDAAIPQTYRWLKVD